MDHDDGGPCITVTNTTQPTSNVSGVMSESTDEVGSGGISAAVVLVVLFGCILGIASSHSISSDTLPL
jgi:hypothetical protein